MAAKSKSGGIEFTVRWHPVLVDRTVGRDGEDRRSYCAVKFGEAAAEHPFGAIERNEARKDGALFADWERWPNTFQAQRLMLLASQQGKAHELSELLYTYTFEGGRNVSTAATLVLAGEQAVCAPFSPASLIPRWGKVANRHVRDFGWEVAPAAVSRRSPISLDTMVARTEGYTNDATVWDLSLVQGPFSVAPRRGVTIRNFSIAVVRRTLAAAATPLSARVSSSRRDNSESPR